MTETRLQRKPGMAALWGFLIGLGIVIYLIFVFPVIGLDSLANVALKAALIVAAVMALSVLWGLFGPARKPKGPAPAEQPPPAPVNETPPPAPDAEEPPPAPRDEADAPASLETDEYQEPAP